MNQPILHLLTGGDAPEAEGRGPLPLFWWLHRRAQHARLEVGQQELADAFRVSTKTISAWTRKLETAGCIYQELQPPRPAKYVLLLPVEEAAVALGMTSQRASE